jgi:hypothetical protein
MKLTPEAEFILKYLLNLAYFFVVGLTFTNIFRLV